MAAMLALTRFPVKHNQNPMMLIPPRLGRIIKRALQGRLNKLGKTARIDTVKAVNNADSEFDVENPLVSA